MKKMIYAVLFVLVSVAAQAQVSAVASFDIQNAENEVLRTLTQVTSMEVETPEIPIWFIIVYAIAALYLLIVGSYNWVKFLRDDMYLIPERRIKIATIMIGYSFLTIGYIAQAQINDIALIHSAIILIISGISIIFDMANKNLNTPKWCIKLPTNLLRSGFMMAVASVVSFILPEMKFESTASIFIGVIIYLVAEAKLEKQPIKKNS